MAVLENKNILLGISSGIAAYKVVDLVKKLKSAGANIKIILTQNAEKLIPKTAFGNVSYTTLFIEGYDYKNFKDKPEIYTHINLAKFPDLIVLAPATANLIGKIANGIADDLLSTTLITTKAKVFVCPSMNCNMYENKIVQENIEKLKRNGYYFIGPVHGNLACGDVGIGRLAEIDEIYNIIVKFFEKKDSLKGKKILVTAGALSEHIDPVRIITNKSSGKMGVAIANEAAFRGAVVTLIRGDTTVMPGPNVKEVKVETAGQMLSEIKKNKKQDIIIHSAAVPDFKPQKFAGKLSSKEEISLKLKPAKKILDEIKNISPKVFLVGFKAEYKLLKEEMIEKAYNRLKKAKCDLIVANDVGKKESGFYSDFNEVYIIDRKKKIVYMPFAPKAEIARRIIDEIEKRAA